MKSDENTDSELGMFKPNTLNLIPINDLGISLLKSAFKWATVFYNEAFCPPASWLCVKTRLEFVAL